MIIGILLIVAAIIILYWSIVPSGSQKAIYKPSNIGFQDKSSSSSQLNTIVKLNFTKHQKIENGMTIGKVLSGQAEIIVDQKKITIIDSGKERVLQITKKMPPAPYGIVFICNEYKVTIAKYNESIEVIKPTPEKDNWGDVYINIRGTRYLK